MAAPISYRPATTNDHALIVLMISELIDELGPDESNDDVKAMLDDDIKTALANPNVCIFLAELEGEAIGLSRGDIHTEDPIFRLRKDHRSGYVDQMHVRAAYRDRGIGYALLNTLETWFRDQGLEHIILHAAPKATRFYARIGYQPNREMFKKL